MIAFIKVKARFSISGEQLIAEEYYWREIEEAYEAGRRPRYERIGTERYQWSTESQKYEQIIDHPEKQESKWKPEY